MGVIITRPPVTVRPAVPVLEFSPILQRSSCVQIRGVLLLLSWPASAEVHLDYTFSQWEKLQDDDRNAYIARFIDTLRTMAATEPAQLAEGHYSQYILRHLAARAASALHLTSKSI
jgi:hypothetical protein